MGRIYKYGVALTEQPWAGLPLRVGNFPRNGTVKGLTAKADSIVVWSGGTSEVLLRSRTNNHVQEQQLLRKSGMCDFLPKETVLEKVSWNGQASACISVTLAPTLVSRLLGQHASLGPQGLRLGVYDVHVVDLVRRLQAQALAEQPWGTAYVQGLSLTLTSYVYGRYGSLAAASADSRSLPTLASEPLIVFVEEHLDKRIGLKELAALSHYSPDHFSRLFQKAFGLSPYRYILSRRVERSKALLRDGKYSLSDVAAMCGFNSQAHFHTTFKSKTSMTPGEYRKG